MVKMCLHNHNDYSIKKDSDNLMNTSYVQTCENVVKYLNLKTNVDCIPFPIQLGLRI